MELTREEAVRLHRQMWLWIAKETERQKQIVFKTDYFKAMKTKREDMPLNTCYCCEYTRGEGTKNTRCELCPMLWGGADNHCLNKNSPFRAWSNTYNWRVAAKAARAIAELPERKVD